MTDHHIKQSAAQAIVTIGKCVESQTPFIVLTASDKATIVAIQAYNAAQSILDGDRTLINLRGFEKPSITTGIPSPGEGYRLLREFEAIAAGDWEYDLGNWSMVSIDSTLIAQKAYKRIIRREKEATVEQ